MAKKSKEKSENEKEQLDIKQLFKSGNIDDINPNILLIITLDKLIDNFDNKDIIPKNMAKAYALLSSTNRVNNDLISELIQKQNDNKGKVKKMYLDVIKNTLHSIRTNSSVDNESRFRLFRH